MVIYRRVIILVLLFFPIVSIEANSINATTDDGRRVILNSDGTWKYFKQPESKSISNSKYEKPASSTILIKTVVKNFRIWIDNKWMRTKTRDPNRYEFEHVKGDAGAIIISERIGMSLEALRRLAINNAKEVSPDVKVVFEENRVVNGVEVLCLKLEGSIDGISFTYLGYYYAGKMGSLQVITYTGLNLFKEFEKDFLDFLNGLEIVN